MLTRSDLKHVLAEEPEENTAAFWIWKADVLRIIRLWGEAEDAHGKSLNWNEKT